MESFRMALFLANKMCVLSEGLDVEERPIWDSLVQMPDGWHPESDPRMKDLLQLLSLGDRLKGDHVRLAKCRQTSYELYKERFSSDQVFGNAGINATMLRVLTVR